MSAGRAAFLLLGVLAGCAARFERGVGGRVFAQVEPSPVVRVALELEPGQSATFETRAASFGSVPVLQLWDVAARRTVARDRACALSLCGARVQCRNAGRSTRQYLLIAHARDNRSAGELDLLRDGKALLPRVRVAGTQLAVAHGAAYSYQVAAGPGGATSASLYALDREGRLIAIADGTGPLGLPRLEAGAEVRRVMVASGAVAPGLANAGPARTTVARAPRVRVYANDRDDGDGDGLGRALERALGTCDGVATRVCARSPLADYYRAAPRATADSDRDGLDDGDELFGVAEPRGLDLPRWGADPRHKDVFVEVDYSNGLAPGAFTPDDFADVAALFARGSASALRNPDGLPGVHLHLDAGLTASTPAQAALFGDWGGSGVAPNDYKKARAHNFTRVRRGYFRYAQLARNGTGQASGDAFTINRDLARAPLFAHELGHTLGLRHHGNDAWGEINCKPNYASVMNYSYQNRRDVGFSLRALAVLNPSRMLERTPIGGKLAALLAAPPLELDVEPGVGVDWNRDGVLEREAVRAAPTWSTYKSCTAGSAGRTTLANDVAAVSPALVRIGSRLHALWIDAQGRLWSRAAELSGPDENGSCPLGDGAQTGCAPWSAPVAIEAGAGIRGLAALPLGPGRAGLAFVDGEGHVRVGVLGEEDAHQVGSVVEVSSIASDRPPALVRMSVDPSFYGVSDVLSVFFRAADPGSAAGAGTLLQASATGLAGPFAVREVLDQAGRPIASPYGPSVLQLGTGETCAVFVDGERFVRFYCYAPERDRWIDLSARAFYAGLGPETGGEVGLAYHRYRAADGSPLGGEDSRGAVYLVFSEPSSGTRGPADNPGLLISQWLSAEHGALARIDFRWRGALSDQWAHLGPQTAVALYEDAELSALKAAFTARVDNALQLDFLPLADGSFDLDLGSGDDFEVMERGICLGLRGPDRCGDAHTARY